MKWLGHKQHFICGDDCQFSLATLLDSGYVVSTIGDYMTRTPDGTKERTTLSSPDLYYETLVFKVKPNETEECGCPIIESYAEIDGRRYQTAKEAQDGHVEFINKWTKGLTNESTEPKTYSDMNIYAEYKGEKIEPFTLDDVRKNIAQAHDKIEKLYKPSLFRRIMNKLGLKS